MCAIAQFDASLQSPSRLVSCTLVDLLSAFSVKDILLAEQVHLVSGVLRQQTDYCHTCDQESSEGISDLCETKDVEILGARIRGSRKAEYELVPATQPVVPNLLDESAQAQRHW